MKGTALELQKKKKRVFLPFLEREKYNRREK
jgi:hypothetical protein